jgi:hypothetical protein
MRLPRPLSVRSSQCHGRFGRWQVVDVDGRWQCLSASPDTSASARLPLPLPAARPQATTTTHATRNWLGDEEGSGSAGGGGIQDIRSPQTTERHSARMDYTGSCLAFKPNSTMDME